MELLKNINWNTERDLNNNPDNDININEENWIVSFDYNGYNLNAVVSFDIDFYRFDEVETNSIIMDVDSVDVGIDELLNGEDDFKLPVKEIIKIQNQLAQDLKIQY